MSLLKLLSQPRYLVLGVTVAILVTAFSAWLPNLGLVQKTVFSSTMTLEQKFRLLTALLGSLRTNFTPLSLIITLFTSILAGIQTSLLVHYLNLSFRISRTLGASTLGIFSSLLGVGCASCGSVVITSFLGISASAGVFLFLPLKGQEFGILGIVILLMSILYTLRKINQPITCQINKESL